MLQNSVEILSNTCLCSNFETCLSYWGYLLAVNSQIYVKTSSLKCAKTMFRNYQVQIMLRKTGSFLKRIVVERANDDLCQKNVKNAGPISAKPIDFQQNLPENNHKIRRYLPIAFRPSLPLKIPAKTADFSAILSPKNPAKFDFFPQSIRSPINVKASVSNHQTSPTQTSLKCCDLVVKYLNQQRQCILTKSSMSKVEKTMEESICSFPALVYLNLTTLSTVKAYMYLSIYKFPQITFKVIFYIDIYLAINMHIFGFRTMNLVKTIPCYN